MAENDRTLFKIRVQGDNTATVRGYLNNAERLALIDHCAKAAVECYIELEKYPLGLDEVLDKQDWTSAHTGAPGITKNRQAKQNSVTGPLFGNWHAKCVGVLEHPSCDKVTRFKWQMYCQIVK